MTKILDGRVVADGIKQVVKSKIQEGNAFSSPGLAVILASNDSSSKLYVSKKEQACQEVGIRSFIIKPFDNIEQWTAQGAYEHLSLVMKFLNEVKKSEVDGILLQLPVFELIKGMNIFNLIPPEKDVDVLTPTNLGLLMQGQPRFKPCTPAAVEEILSYYKISTIGKRVTIINRSNIIGKPLFSMMIQDSPLANATVTLCHDKTPPEMLKEICLDSDIIIVAVGIPNFIKSDMVRSGQTIIDVGINRISEKKVIGDVDFENVAPIVDCITPVPGGVGPVTVAMLLSNTLKAKQCKQNY